MTAWRVLNPMIFGGLVGWLFVDLVYADLLVGASMLFLAWIMYVTKPR